MHNHKRVAKILNILSWFAFPMLLVAFLFKNEIGFLILFPFSLIIVFAGLFQYTSGRIVMSPPRGIFHNAIGVKYKNKEKETKTFGSIDAILGLVFLMISFLFLTF